MIYLLAFGLVGVICGLLIKDHFYCLLITLLSSAFSVTVCVRARTEEIIVVLAYFSFFIALNLPMWATYLTKKHTRFVK